MSQFSDYLAMYMEKREILPTTLADMVNKDRGSIYRYVKGKRIPQTEQLVIKMAKALRMNVAEQDKLLRYYEYESIGKNVVHEYGEFLAFLESLCEPDGGAATAEDIQIVNRFKDEEGIYPFEVSTRFAEVLHFLVEQSKRMEDSKICFFIRPEQKLIDKILRVISDREIDMECIVALEQAKDKSNLSQIRQMLRVAYLHNKYEINCYYTNLATLYSDFTWKQNIIFAGKYVCLLDCNDESGMLIINTTYGNSLRKWYDIIKNETMSLFCGELQYLRKEDDDINEMLGFQPCFGMVMSSDIYQENLYEYPNKQDLIDGLVYKNGDWIGLEYYPGHGRVAGQIFFVAEGIYYFIETGRCIEMAEALYEPLSMQQRKLVLQRMIKISEQFAHEICLIDADITLPENYFFYGERKENGKLKSVWLQRITECDIQMVCGEENINLQYESFLKYLQKKGCIRTAEETRQWLQRVIEERF